MTENVDLFEDALLASVYDDLNPWEAGHDFYLGLARESGGAVLDLGCGTGMLACRIAAEGYEVTGAEPAAGMLAVARARPDGKAVTWIESDGQNLRLDRRFDLIYMTGHAFQALLSDEAAMALLAAAARHLKPEGRFVFETRNPAKQEWLTWTPGATREVVQTAAQGRVETFYDAESDAGIGIVRIAQHCRFLDQDTSRIGRSRIRFIERDHLERLITGAGLVANTWYGDWDRSPCTPASKEIIAVTGRAD
jgi:SAM-dependent methyltransferase